MSPKPIREPTARKRRRKPRELPHVGWREWVELPELGLSAVKAKIDTGARSSALHAFDIEREERPDGAWVRFRVHPLQRDARLTVEAEAPLVDQRWVRSSSGRRTFRPVIRTLLQLGQESWPIEITLIRRDVMGFRMLLGRQALRHRLLVDPGRSFLCGRTPRIVLESHAGPGDLHLRRRG